MSRIPTPAQLATIIAGLLVVVLVVWLLPVFWWSPYYPCDGGLRHEQAECIGVTDSSDFADPLLADVMSKIANENREVTGAYYGVGYLVPLEPADARTALAAELRHELQGAYLAQVRANDTSEIEGGGLRVKLFVGNAGVDNRYWPEVVDRFRAMASGDERLRAVVGLGTSLDTTRQAIAALTGPPPPGEEDAEEAVAAIGARLTADSLSLDQSSRRVDGFFRAAPTNTDEARAAAQYIRSKGFVRPILIRDTSGGDLYAATLGTAFRASYGPTPEATFDSSKDGLGSAFGGIVRNMCSGTPPDTVYFAGRGEALAQFIDVLADQGCEGAKVNVFTGDDISGIRDLAQEGDVGVRAALSGDVTVTYTGLAHPTMWTAGDIRSSYSLAALTYFESDCPSCYQTAFGGDSLDDGAALMSHDAVLLAVTAIRRAGELNTSGDAAEVSPGAVIQLLYQIRGVDSARGVSGRLSLSSCGDAEGKLFPLLSLGADGRSSLVAAVSSQQALPC